MGCIFSKKCVDVFYVVGDSGVSEEQTNKKISHSEPQIYKYPDPYGVFYC